MIEEVWTWRLADAAVKKYLDSDNLFTGSVQKVNRLRAIIKAIKSKANSSKSTEIKHNRLESHVVGILDKVFAFEDAKLLEKNTENNELLLEMGSEIECNLEILEKLLSAEEGKLFALERRLSELETEIKLSVDLDCLDKHEQKLYTPNSNKFKAAEPVPIAKKIETDDVQSSDKYGDMIIKRRLPPVVKKDTNILNKNPVDQGEGSREEHEELSGILLDLAQQMKRRYLDMGQLFAKDKTVLDKTATHVESNLDRVAAEQRRLADLSRKSWANTWRLILFAFCIIFSLILCVPVILVSRR